MHDDTNMQSNSINDGVKKLSVWKICVAVISLVAWFLLFGESTLNFISSSLIELSPQKSYVLNLEKSEHMIEAFGYTAEMFKEDIGDADYPKITIMQEYANGNLWIKFSGPDVFDAWSKVHIVEREFQLVYDETVDGIKRYYTYEENMKEYYWLVYEDHITYGNSILYFE